MAPGGEASSARGATAWEFGAAAVGAATRIPMEGAGEGIGASENAAGAGTHSAFFTPGCLWQGGVLTAGQGTAAQRAAHWACQSAKDTAARISALRPRIQFHPTPAWRRWSMVTGRARGPQ